MNKNITTGQLVDKLKVGETAQCVSSSIEDWYGSHVTAKQHSWNWTLKNGESEEFYLSEAVKECTWRILPKFVHYLDAAKALKDGHTVRCYPEEDENYIEFNEADTVESVGYSWNLITWGELLGGKWTIED